MCKLRDWVVFLAGVEFFHTLVHVMMPHVMSLPMDMKVMVMTSTMNTSAIIVNAVITVMLIWWARRLR
ncbi:MAG: hypothetical protein K2Y18_08980 [Alphaproteobacteria bacterium]|jgi:hypothetical protein|nr:hypothetical protein [Alphaproteobacteria bacterium]